MEKKISIEYTQLTDWKELNEADQKLVVAAENILKKSRKTIQSPRRLHKALEY